MKIMRHESWSGGCGAIVATHIMRSGIPPVLRRPYMQWQTPTATVWRFGFEITLYVGAR
jgi:hypothetical protein